MNRSFSTLDFIRNRAQDCLDTCPRDEARTREYVHRTKVQCELVVERRKLRGKMLLGQVKTPPKKQDELPAISQSAPASPIERASRMSFTHSRNLLDPKRSLSNASTVFQDRRSLSAMAKLHGGVAIEYKIPPDVTWSEHMATKPKEWCEFVLDKPNRTWNWEQRLTNIEKTCENVEIPAAERLKNSATLFEDECRMLKQISASLLVTRKDEEIKECKRQYAELCEKTLQAQFDLACNSKRMGTGVLFNQLTDKTKKSLDVRDFGTYLTNLGIVPDLISKTDAQRHFAASKLNNKDVNELDFVEFKLALRSIAKAVGKPLTQLIGIPPVQNPLKQEGDRIKEAVDEKRDAHILNEREVLARLLEETPSAPMRNTISTINTLSSNLELDSFLEGGEPEPFDAETRKHLEETASETMETESDMLSSIRSDVLELKHSAVSHTDASQMNDLMIEALRNIDRALSSTQLSNDVPLKRIEKNTIQAEASHLKVKSTMHEKEQILLRQIEMSAEGSGLSTEVFDLIESFFTENYDVFTAKDVGRLFRKAHISAQEVKRRALQALNSGHHIQTFFAILRSMQRTCLEDEDVGVLLKKFIHDLKESIPVPSKHSNWISRGASVVSMTSPTNVLIGEEITFFFDFCNRHANSEIDVHHSYSEMKVGLDSHSRSTSQNGWKDAVEQRDREILQEKKHTIREDWRHKMIAAKPLLRHSSKDFVAVCKVRSEPEITNFNKYENLLHVRKHKHHLTALESAVKHVSNELEHDATHDLIVATIEVPPGNTGIMSLPKGLGVPGKYVLKYFSEGSLIPLSVSQTFEVSFPKIEIKIMASIEMGRPIQIFCALTNGFEAEPVYTSETDWIGVFFDEDPHTCIWRKSVPSWCKTTSMHITDIPFGQPGKYTIQYSLGLHHDHVAGSASFRATFPRRSANRFDSLEIDYTSLEESREVRVFLSLDAEDMDQEQKQLMTEGILKLQSLMEEYLVTVSFTCLNWRVDTELSCTAKSLDRLFAEVDRCRPFFVGILGDRYGHVPQVPDAEFMSVIKKYPWFNDVRNPYLQEGLRQSITELEFSYAFLYANSQPSSHISVYFRDPCFALNLLDTSDRLKYFPQKTGNISLKKGKLALNDLKMRTRVKPLVTLCSYKTPKEVSDRVVQDLSNVLMTIFPKNLTPNDIQKTKQFAQFLIRAHTRIIDRHLFADQLSHLERLLKSDNNLVLIIGDRGSGKTSFALQWLERHVSCLSARTNQNSCSCTAFCSNGPRRGLERHLLISTFIHEDLKDRSLAGKNLVPNFLPQSLLTKEYVPSLSKCVEETDAWFAAASEHGIIWLIDGLQLVDSVDFSWLLRPLRIAQSGILVILTCTPISSVRTAVDGMNLSNVGELFMEKLSASTAWDIQTLYFQQYGIEEIDESTVAKLCNHSETPLLLRVNLMGFRLLGTEAAASLVNLNDASEAFIHIVKLLKKARPVLFETLLLLSLANCGLRESEILELTECSTQYLRELRDLLLDEFMVSSYGIMHYKDLSLKQALREYYVSMPADDDCHKTIWRALQFFSIRASVFRRACEGPHLAYKLAQVFPESHKSLFELTSSYLVASQLLETGQADLLLTYLKAMKSGPCEFCAAIMSDFKKHQAGHKTVEQSDHTEAAADFDIFQSIVDLFRAFGDNNCIDFKGFVFMMDYLDLEGTHKKISRREVSKLFDSVASSTMQRRKTHLDYQAFKTMILQLSKIMKVSCAGFVKEAMAKIKLRKLFEKFSVVRNISNTRTGTIDSNEFLSILQSCSLLGLIQRFDALEIFKKSLGAANSHDVVQLMKFQNFVACMGEVANFLKIDLETVLTPKRSATPAAKQRLSLLGMEDESTDLRGHSKEFVGIFCRDAIRLANLFSHVKQEIYALEILYSTLVSAYGLESYSELSHGQPLVKNIAEIVAAIELVSDCSIRMAQTLNSMREALTSRLNRMQDEISELEQVVQEEKKMRNKRRNTIMRDALQESFDKNIQRLNQLSIDIPDTQAEVEILIKELDELRRRASICCKAAQRLIIKATLTSQERITLLVSIKTLKTDELKWESEHWISPKISWSLVFRLVHAINLAKERISKRKLAEAAAVKQYPQDEKFALLEKFAVSSFRLEPGTALESNHHT